MLSFIVAPAMALTLTGGFVPGHQDLVTCHAYAAWQHGTATTQQLAREGLNRYTSKILRSDVNWLMATLEAGLNGTGPRKAISKYCVGRMFPG